MQRRIFFQNSLLGAAAFSFLPQLKIATESNTEPLPSWPLPDLKKILPDKILIESVELLQVEKYLLLVVRPNWCSKVEAKNGQVEIPVRPGLGIEYDEAVLEKAQRVV